jgi:signal transduction histidine kinase/CheY-like chemotaxis protein
MIKKSKIKNYIWIVIPVIIALVALFTAHFYQFLQLQLFTERQSHLIDMTAKISEVIDVTIETIQEKTDSAAVFMAESDMSSDGIADKLSDLSQKMFIDDGMLLAIDSMARYYDSDGNVGRWSDTEDLVSDDTEPLIHDLTVGDEKKACMVFFKKLATERTFDDSDIVLTHVAVIVPIEEMKEYLTISMFGEQCYTYLITAQGRRLYQQTAETTFIGNINVLSDLESDRFVHGGDLDDLKTSIEDRQSFSAEFKNAGDGQNYFVSTVPVSKSAWTVLLFVPTDVLGVQSERFMDYMLWYFACIAVMSVAVLGYMVFAITTTNNDKRMMEQQESNNAQLELSNAKLELSNMKLEEANTKLEDSNAKLEVAVQAAQSASAAKSEFLSHMSHDIRTPINGILGMTHIAMTNRGNQAKIDDCIGKINGAAEHLLTLINDVLDMSAIENGKVVISHDPIDLRVLLNNCASIIEGQILSRHLTFNKLYGDFEHPYVFGDELHMRQVFINILGNAVKFTPDGGTIEMRVQEVASEDDRVAYHFEFEDNGIGISEEFLTKIFDEFSQAEKGGRTNYQGTGLGMAISKNFVELMGGHIGVRSKLGEGSCFTVDLTFDVDSTPKEEEVAPMHVELKDMRVLLVEDNELNMEIASEILKEEGILVDSAENGKIAVDKFMASKPGDYDVILMDIMMPVMNGYEATRAIRSSDHPLAKTIPIVAMTANAYREDVDKAFAAGMDEHVPKPIDIKHLMKVLERYKASYKAS